MPQIDESTGALVYEYILAVPPGRNGLTPDLTLRYNSQLQEDGVFGLGWSIDIPHIERLNKKGSDKLYSESYFASSIDGELVQVGSTTEYRAKIEDGTFLKYVLSSNTWTVTDKQGTVYKFGHQTATQQNDPGATSAVYRWFLEEVRDTNDNFIKYEYYKDNGEIYPWKITYTGNGTTDGIFQVEFFREARADTLGSYAGAFQARTNYRISEIQTKVNGTWARKYKLDYGPGDNTNRSMLTLITESGQSESAVTVSYPATEFTYETSSKTMTSQAGAWGLPAYLVVDDVAKGYALAEVNGDGLVDLIFSQSGTGTTNKKVYINTGSQWSYNSSWVVPNVSVLTFEYGFTNAIDVNADGLADLVLSCSNDGNSNTVVYLNTGSGWSSAGSWGIPTTFVGKSGTTITDHGFTFGDVNGDGLVDLLQANGSNRKVYINTSSQWSEDSTWTLPSTFNFTNSMASAIDVNHDNLADIVWSATDSGSTNKNVYINTGHGWSYDSGWVVPGPFVEKSGSTITDFGFRLTDLNNDGFVDIVHAPTTSTKTAYINTGETWTQDATWTFPTGSTFTMKANRVRAADVDGDGLADFVLSAQNAGSGNNIVYLNPGNKPDLVEIIKNRNGGTITVEYKQTPLYTSGGSLLNPDFPFIIDTVSRVTNDDGLGNSWSHSHTYEGADFYFNTYLDRKFAGFSKVTMTDGLGTITKTFYHQGNSTNSAEGEYSDDISKLGKAYRAETLNSSSSLFRLQLSKWENYNLGTGANFVKNTQVMQLDYDGDGDHRDLAESYAYNDTNGNLTQKIEWGEVIGAADGTFSDTGSDAFTTVVSYAANTTGYILSLPSLETVSNQCGTKVKESKYYYDGQPLGSVNDGNLTKREDWVTGWSYVDIERTYDGTYGLVATEKDPRDKTTTYAYDSYHLYPVTTTDPLSHQVTYTYDYSAGKVKTRTDENNRVFETVYDGFDRPLEERVPSLASPASLVARTTYQYTDNSVPTRIKQSNLLDTSVSADLYKYFDGFGRLIQQRAEVERSNEFAVADLVYDDGELLGRESLPYFSTGSARTVATLIPSLYTEYTYDALDRKKLATNLLGATAYAYDQWRTTITDAESNAKEFVRDAYGNLVEVVEQDGASAYATTYRYDYLRNLTKVTDALNNIRTVAYDGLGRRTSLEDLHVVGDGTFGTWSFEYDVAGNLISRTDPKSQVVQYTYDDINRALTENYTGAAGTEVTYVYDTCTEGVGRLCTATTAGAVTRYDYNAVGGIGKEAKVVDSTTYETEFSYDRQGNITTLIYPDDSVVRYSYNVAGQLERLEQKESGGSFTDVVSDFNYNAAGKATTQLHANGITTTKAYDTMYRLVNILTRSCPSVVSGSSLETNLVSYWSLDESSTGSGAVTRADRKGSNNLTDINTTLSTSGVIGNAADFETDNDERLAITDGAQSGLDITGDLSFATWIKFESLPVTNDRRYVLQKEDIYKFAPDWDINGTDYLRLYLRDAAGYYDTKVSWVPTTGTWHHVAFTRQQSTGDVKFYLDGVQQGATQATGRTAALLNSVETFALGSEGGEWDGLVDETGIWSRALTSKEIGCLYNGGNGIAYSDGGSTTTQIVGTTLETNLAAYWPLGEPSGTRIDAHSINDLSDNNTVLSATGKIGIGADFESSASEYLSIADGSQTGLDITGDYSIGGWVKLESTPSSSTSYALYNKGGNSGSDGGLGCEYSNVSGTTRIRSSWYKSPSSFSRVYHNFTISTGTWYHIVCVVDIDAPSNSRIYIDGTSYTPTVENADATSANNNSEPVEVGRSKDDQHFDGLLDELGIWSRILTTQEIQYLYNNGSGIPYTTADTALAPTNVATARAAPLNPSTESLIASTSAEQKATIKGREIAARVKGNQRFSREDLDIEIVDIDSIEGGVEVFARAWDTNGSQIGFGPDGTVDVERFRIFNPPILVPDKTGPVVRPYEDAFATASVTDSPSVSTRTSPRRFREDPQEAVLQVLEHAISVTERHDPTLIVSGKRGNTTDTFYPNANPETTSFDGYILEYDTSWDPLHDEDDADHASVAISDSATTGWAFARFRSTSPAYTIGRSYFLFDTSALPNTDTVTSATFSLYGVEVRNNHTNGNRNVGVVQSSPASNTGLATTDFDQCGAINTPTEGAARIALSSLSTSAYNNFVLNTAGKGWISKIGATKLCLRVSYDLDDVAPSNQNDNGSGFNHYQADQAGTTQDPVLVVEHTVSPSSSSIQDIRYTYDAVGNIIQIADYSATDAAKVVVFGYDDLYRLTSASTTEADSTPFSQTYTYDPLGNMTSKSDVGSYTYAGTGYANPHAATSIAGTTLGYDNDGNVVSYGSNTYSWDYRNRLVSLTASGTTATYGYDHTTERVKKIVGAATSIYPNDYYSVEGATTTRFIYAGGDLVATLEKVGSAIQVYHVHNDHLGSTNVVTNAAGSVTQVLDYYPYGSVRIDIGTDVSGREFIGEFVDEESGLSYLNARHYMASRGQFLSQDPVFWEIGLKTQEGLIGLANPQLQNSYSYAGNNPIAGLDPSGRAIALPLIVPVLELLLPVIQSAGAAILGSVAAVVTINAISKSDESESEKTPMILVPSRTEELPPSLDPNNLNLPPGKYSAITAATFFGLGSLYAIHEFCDNGSICINLSRSSGANQSSTSTSAMPSASPAKSPISASVVTSIPSSPSSSKNFYSSLNSAQNALQQASEAIKSGNYSAAKRHLSNASRSLKNAQRFNRR